MPISHINTFNSSHLNADGSSSNLQFDGLHAKLRKQLNRLTSSKKNFVVADLSVIFETTAGIVLSLSIPVRDPAWKAFGYNSLKQNNELSTMTNFYKAHKDIGGKGNFHAQSHGHSEIYLYYYLQSPHRLKEIFDHWTAKGLKADKVQHILKVNLHICTTNSVCGTCTALTLGTTSKDGFTQSFSTILKQEFVNRNFQVATDFEFQVRPSYTIDYGHETKIEHLNPTSQIKTPNFPNILRRFRDISYLKYLQEAKQQNSTCIDYINIEGKADQQQKIAMDLLERESLTDRFNITGYRTHLVAAQGIVNNTSFWISQSFAHTAFVSSSSDTSKSSSPSQDTKNVARNLSELAHKTIAKFFRECKQKNERLEQLVSESFMSSCL